MHQPPLQSLPAQLLPPELVLEPSRGAALFPHLYRAIALSELLGAWRLSRAPGGAWVLPRLGGEGEPDRPAAQVWSDVLPAAGPG